jgi:hypothetical protein
MECLACGDCCKRMSPLTNSEKTPCPRLVMNEDIAHCARYADRPKECASHDFPARICPIGMSVLKLTTSEAVQARAYAVYLDRGGESM